MKRLYNDICLLALFFVGTFLFIRINFHFWYHFMEQYMMFQYTDDYFQELMKAPGGLSEYFTEYVSQLFYNDLGAPLVLAVLLTLMAGLFHRFLCYCGSKVAIWAAMIPAFLFWIFPVESVAFPVCIDIALALTLAGIVIRQKTSRYIYFLAIIIVSYLLFSPAQFLIALLWLLYEVLTEKGKGLRWIGVVGLILAFLVPLVAMRTFFIASMRDAFFTKNLYHPEYPLPKSLWLVVASFPVCALLAYAVRERVFLKNDMARMIVMDVLILGAMTYKITYTHHPLEQAYRYDYYARQNKWQAIVDHAEKHGIEDRDALIYLNLALSHTGQMNEKLFNFPQIGEIGFIPHDAKSRLALIEASEVAWQLGQTNSSQRFAFVGVLSSERRVQSRLMKRLVESYLVDGEYRAAGKYIKILESSHHYRNWAKQQEALLDSTVCARTKWVADKRRYLPITDNPIDLTISLPSGVAFLIDDHFDNRPAFEYGMAYLLVYKQLPAFMHYMGLMRDKGMTFPKLYQEAICLYFSAVHRDPAEMATFKLDQNLVYRFAMFMHSLSSLSPQEAAQQYGDTYYYYAQFNPGPKE